MNASDRNSLASRGPGFQASESAGTSASDGRSCVCTEILEGFIPRHDSSSINSASAIVPPSPLEIDIALTLALEVVVSSASVTVVRGVT